MSDNEFLKGDASSSSLSDEMKRQLALAEQQALLCELGKMVCARADDRDVDGVRMIVETYPQLVNGRDAVNDTPLICSIYASDRTTFDYLLQKNGIDINAQGEDKITALMHAIYEKSPYFAFKLLDRPDIDVTIQDKDDATAVMDAVENENLAVLEILLSKAGTDVMQRNRDGENAASLAAKLGKGSENDDIRDLIKGHPSYRVVPEPAPASPKPRRGKRSPDADVA